MNKSSESGAKSSSESKRGPSIDLRAIEEETLREGQKFMRRYMKDKLLEAAEALSLEEKKSSEASSTRS